MVDKSIFRSEESGSWQNVTSQVGDRLQHLKKISQLDLTYEQQYLLLSLDEVLKVITTPGIERFHLLHHLVGSELCKRISLGDQNYLAKLQHQLSEKKNQQATVHSVTEEEYRNCLDFLDDNPSILEDSEQLLEDFELLDQSAKHLRQARSDLDLAKQNLAHEEKLNSESNDDRLCLITYDRLQRGCKLSYDKLRQEQEHLSNMEQDYAVQMESREKQMANLTILRELKERAQSVRDEFLSDQEQKEQVIEASRKLDGNIEIISQRCESFQNQLKEKKAEMNDNEQRIAMLREREFFINDRLSKLTDFVSSNADMDKYCNELEKVIDSLTKYIETDARITKGREHFKILSQRLDEQKDILDEADEQLKVANRQIADRDITIENAANAKTSADANLADSKISSLGHNIEFIKSLSNEIGFIEHLFEQLLSLESKSEQVQQQSQEAHDKLIQVADEIKIVDSELQEKKLRLEFFDNCAKVNELRSHIHDGDQCPLCGGIIAKLQEFINESVDEKNKLEADFQQLRLQKDQLQNQQQHLTDQLRQIERQRIDQKFQLEVKQKEIADRCLVLNDKTLASDLKIHWDDSSGQFTKESFANGIAQLDKFKIAYENEFDELVHLKNENEKAFLNFTIAQNELTKAQDDIAKQQGNREKIEKDYQMLKDEFDALKDDLDLFSEHLSDLTHVLQDYLGDNWEVIYNTFIREHNTISQKEQAIEKWEQDCRNYISSKDQIVELTAEKDKLAGELEVAIVHQKNINKEYEEDLEDFEKALDELNDLKEERSRLMDESVSEAVEHMRQEEQSSTEQLHLAVTNLEAMTQKIDSSDNALLSLKQQMGQCRENIAQFRSEIEDFIASNEALTGDMIEDLLQRDASFYETLRTRLQNLEISVNNAHSTLSKTETRVNLCHDEYQRRLRHIPNVNDADIDDDGILSDDWIRRQIEDRHKVDHKFENCARIKQIYENETKLSKDYEQEIRELENTIDRLKGYEDSFVTDDDGFTLISKNITMKQLVDAANGYMEKGNCEYRFDLIDPAEPVQSLSFELVNMAKGGISTNVQLLSKATLTKASLALSMAIFTVGNLASLVSQIWVDSSLELSDLAEATQTIDFLVQTKLEDHELYLMSSDPMLVQQLGVAS